jgi:4,5-DOPA dioxygenase extradiol
MENQPVLLISHGAPTFALEPGQLGPQLATLGRQLSAVRAALVISAH